MRRILSVLLENESGALSRVIGLFSQRGYNIESLTVAPTDDPTLSRMTIQTVGDEKAIEQIEKQLHKLVDVLRVSELGHLVDIMNAEPDKTFNIAVSGGSTPALMFDLWANEYADITPWKRMKLYWVASSSSSAFNPA